MADSRRTLTLQDVNREIHKTFGKVFEKCMKLERTYLALTKDLSRSFNDLQNMVSGMPNRPLLQKTSNVIASDIYNDEIFAVDTSPDFPTELVLLRIGHRTNPKVAERLKHYIAKSDFTRSKCVQGADTIHRQLFPLVKGFVRSTRVLCDWVVEHEASQAIQELEPNGMSLHSEENSDSSTFPLASADTAAITLRLQQFYYEIDWMSPETATLLYASDKMLCATRILEELSATFSKEILETRWEIVRFNHVVLSAKLLRLALKSDAEASGSLDIEASLANDMSRTVNITVTTTFKEDEPVEHKKTHGKGTILLPSSTEETYEVIRFDEFEESLLPHDESLLDSSFEL